MQGKSTANQNRNCKGRGPKCSQKLSVRPWCLGHTVPNTCRKVKVNFAKCDPRCCYPQGNIRKDTFSFWHLYLLVFSHAFLIVSHFASKLLMFSQTPIYSECSHLRQVLQLLPISGFQLAILCSILKYTSYLANQKCPSNYKQLVQIAHTSCVW